jgi:hypothetical protein
MTAPEYELLSKLPRPAVGAVRTNLPVVEESGVHPVSDQAFKGLASRMAVKGYIR